MFGNFLRRYSVIFIVLFFTQVSAHCQNKEEVRISGTYHNISLLNFLDQLEKQYSIVFYFKPEWFQKDSVNLFFNSTPLSEALQRAVKSKAIVEVQNSCYVFLPLEEIALLNGQGASNEEVESGTRIVGNLAEAGKYNKVVVKGVVSDGKNGETLVGSTIQVENTNIACVTNNQGQYSLTTTPGTYNLIVSNVGYEKVFQKVKVVSNGELNIELFEKTTKINEIYIYAQKADRNVRSSQMSIVELDSKTIKQLPSIIGEKDIIKSFTMMPGVKSVGEFGSGINIRGGSTDENLFLVEGTPLFNTSHVFGLISVIDPDMVNSVTLYKGHIPSNFGERVSSVMDIQLKDNNAKVFGANGGIGILNSRLMLDIPVYKQNVTLKIGGRTTYSNWILRNLNDYTLRSSSLNFYDLSGVLTWTFGSNRIVALAYTSNDNFRYITEFNYNYKNNLGSVTWSHYFSRDVSSSLAYSFSQYNMSKDSLSASNDQNRIFSEVNYQSLKFNISSKRLNSHSVDAGIQGIYYSVLPGERTPLDTNSKILPITIPTEKAIESAIYINDKWELSSFFSINAGLRYSIYTELGPGIVYNYLPGRTRLPVTKTDSSNYGNNAIMQFYHNLEPRVAFKFQLDNSSSVKLSYNRNTQYIFLISNTVVPSPNDIWKLADKYVKPLECNHFALGLYRNFNQNKIETSVEVYYKTLKNLVEYKNNANLVLNSTLETELINASGKNYGVEFFVKKNFGEIDGWFSYTYSRSLKKTDSPYPEEIINNNRYYPSSYDKPHEITVTTTWHINRRTRLAGNFNYSTGRSVTLPAYQYQIDNWSVIQYADRNSYRLPDYHRLDLSLSVDENLRVKKMWKGSWTFSIMNVYGRKNVYSVYYVNEKPTAANNYKSAVLYKLSIIGIPLVSLTYNFIF